MFLYRQIKQQLYVHYTEVSNDNFFVANYKIATIKKNQYSQKKQPQTKLRNKIKQKYGYKKLCMLLSIGRLFAIKYKYALKEKEIV